MDISRPRLDFRGSLFFSALLHASLLAVFVLTRPQVIEVAMPGNIPIALESGPAGPVATAAPAAVAPAVKPAPREIKKDEVAEAHKKKKEPPKAVPKKPEPTRPVPPSQTPPSASTSTSPAPAPGGAPGAGEARIGTAGTPGTSGDTRLGYYLLAVRNKIGSNWSPPGVDRRTKASVFFKVDRRGAVTEIQLEQSSGSPVFDQLAIRAVKNAAPLPPLPDFFTQPELGVHFDFEQSH